MGSQAWASALLPTNAYTGSSTSSTTYPTLPRMYEATACDTGATVAVLLRLERRRERIELRF
jgi:hypothetical protein